jgi:hypothetical protein
MRASSSWSQPQPQPEPELQSQPQPQPLRQGRRQASWKAGIEGLYRACTPAMDPISEVQIIEKKGRGPRMFRQPPKRKSDAVKASKQVSFSSPKRE